MYDIAFYVFKEISADLALTASSMLEQMPNAGSQLVSPSSPYHMGPDM